MPKRPDDFVRREALHYRFAGSGALHRWGFRRGKCLVETRGGLVVDDRQLLVDCAVQGLGQAFVSKLEAGALIDQGKLEAFLQSSIRPISGCSCTSPRARRRS